MSQSAPDDTTDFGFEQVPPEEKTRRVGAVFSSVAERYDLMNDLMSFGLHRLWKHFAMMASGVRPGQQVLDLAGGTGDLTRRLAERVGAGGRVVLADLNAAMLARGRDRLIDAGVGARTAFVQTPAEALPFRPSSFHCVTIGFGLRNFTDKTAALREIHRVLKPGGRLLVLEFSQPVIEPLQRVYDWYSFNVIPRLGKVVTGDEGSYRYLVESIRRHPAQAQLKAMMEQAGFERCEYFNLAGGIVALHRGYRL